MNENWLWKLFESKKYEKNREKELKTEPLNFKVIFFNLN